MPTDRAFLDGLLVRPIAPDIDLGRFKCEESIDKFLRERACEHHRKRMSAVTCWMDGNELAGYMTTTMGYTQFTDAKWWLDIKMGDIRFFPQGKVQDKFPAMLIGMLGVDTRYKGRGLGKEMVQTAIVYAMDAASTVGCRIVHVDSDRTDVAMGLYRAMGFSMAQGQEKRTKAWMYLDLKERDDDD
jgi:ribosomal protein S18 acetylase RimI-like enzyme